MHKRTDIRLSAADRSELAAVVASRMMDALVTQLSGDLHFEDGKPGTRAVLVAPIDWRGGGRSGFAKCAMGQKERLLTLGFSLRWPVRPDSKPDACS
jgi:hypothetical protein